jgi:hypothetical protein
MGLPAFTVEDSTRVSILVGIPGVGTILLTLVWETAPGCITFPKLLEFVFIAPGVGIMVQPFMDEDPTPGVGTIVELDGLIPRIPAVRLFLAGPFFTVA